MLTALFQNGMPVDSLVVTEKQFLFAGQLMAMSLLQGGVLANILSACCYKIVSLSTTVNPTAVMPTSEFLNSEKIKKVQIFSYI